MSGDNISIGSHRAVPSTPLSSETQQASSTKAGAKVESEVDQKTSSSAKTSFKERVQEVSKRNIRGEIRIGGALKILGARVGLAAFAAGKSFLAETVNEKGKEPPLWFLH